MDDINRRRGKVRAVVPESRRHGDVFDPEKVKGDGEKERITQKRVLIENNSSPSHNRQTKILPPFIIHL